MISSFDASSSRIAELSDWEWWRGWSVKDPVDWIEEEEAEREEAAVVVAARRGTVTSVANAE